MSDTNQEGFETRAIHAGHDYVGGTGAVTPPIYLSSTFEYGNEHGFDYTRSGNPNFRLLDRALASMEGGIFSTVFGSGVGAITAIVSTLKSGDHIVAEENIYGCTYRLLDQVFAKFGITVSYHDLTDAANFEKIAEEKPTLVWIESPTNPLLKVIDIAAVADATHAAGATLVVDNTFASSYLQRPLELGADLVVHSTTKYIDGHNATVGGAVVSRDAANDEKVRFVQIASGTIVSPQVAWLTMQGCKTLSVRMEQQSANALAIAKFLEGHPKVDRVQYPGLESFPQHALARRQSSGFGAMVWFEVHGGVAAGKRLMDAIQLWSLAENLGSVESLVTHPVTMTHADVDEAERKRVGITDGLVRLSVGLEDAGDLIAALDEALKQV